MSNNSVNAIGGHDSNSGVGGNQGQRTEGEGRSVEDQLQELRAMMANLATQVGQLALRQQQPVVNPQAPPVLNPDVRREGVIGGHRGR